MLGAALQMVADYRVLLTGRFVGGLGVGASSMLSPQFLAENAPKSVRGSFVASYNLLIVTSLCVAFFVNYGVSLWDTSADDNTQWRVAMGIQIIPGALMCLMVPFVPDSPRWLINHGKSEQGLRNLTRLRKLPAEHVYVQTEYQEIEAQVRSEQEVCTLYTKPPLRSPLSTFCSCAFCYRHDKGTRFGPFCKTFSWSRAIVVGFSWP